MDFQELLEKLTSIELTINEIKSAIIKEAKPYRLAFVNFFAGGKSYAYTADESIEEGDVVLVNTASRGDIAGVVTYTQRYSEDDLPFHNTKTVIGKLDAVASEHNIDSATLVAMTVGLAPAIADKERAKATLLAFLARRSQTENTLENGEEDTSDIPFPEAEDTPSPTETFQVYDDDEVEGADVPTQCPDEPDTTVIS